MTPTKRMLACATTLAALVATLGRDHDTGRRRGRSGDREPARRSSRPTAATPARSASPIRNTGAEAQAPRVIFAEPTPVPGWTRPTRRLHHLRSTGSSPPASRRAILCRPDRIPPAGRTAAADRRVPRPDQDPRLCDVGAQDIYVRLNGRRRATLLGERHHHPVPVDLRFAGQPAPYVQDTQPTRRCARRHAVLCPHARPGRDFVGRLTVTVQWRGDYAAEFIDLGTEAMPPGVSDRPDRTAERAVPRLLLRDPGRRIMPGEVRTFDVLLSGSIGAHAGSGRHDAADAAHLVAQRGARPRPGRQRRAGRR